MYNHSHNRRLWTWFLPTPGNVIFTLLVVTGVLYAQSVGAISLGAPAMQSNTSTGTIAYQGRLADTAGSPITQNLDMTFTIYDVANGGTALWTEDWSAIQNNQVAVSDGLFNVMLGSIIPIPQAAIVGKTNLFLGITIGADNEMSPRIQLGSVPFAMQALTVPDGSITSNKLSLPHGEKCLTTNISKSLQANWVQADIPELTLNFELDKPSLVQVAIDGNAQPLGTAGGASSVFFEVDGESIRGSLSYGNGGQWFDIKGQKQLALGAGNHEITVHATSGSARDFTIRGDADVWRTCVSYIVLGQQ